MAQPTCHEIAVHPSGSSATNRAWSLPPVILEEPSGAAANCTEAPEEEEAHQVIPDLEDPSSQTLEPQHAEPCIFREDSSTVCEEAAEKESSFLEPVETQLSSHSSYATVWSPEPSNTQPDDFDLDNYGTDNLGLAESSQPVSILAMPSFNATAPVSSVPHVLASQLFQMQQLAAQ
eukprot:scaffold231019_cov42-Prasinocladus_malaysianus.AAC.1